MLTEPSLLCPIHTSESNCRLHSTSDISMAMTRIVWMTQQQRSLIQWAGHLMAGRPCRYYIHMEPAYLRPNGHHKPILINNMSMHRTIYWTEAALNTVTVCMELFIQQIDCASRERALLVCPYNFVQLTERICSYLQTYVANIRQRTTLGVGLASHSHTSHKHL